MALTENQKRIIKSMLKEGRKIAEIADALGISSIQVALLASKMTSKNCEITEHKLNSKIGSEKKYTESSNNENSKQNNTEIEGDIIIGYNNDNVPIKWNPIIAPNPHLMVVGESGFGKTYGITGILCELSQIGLPSIIIDYSRSYEEKNFPEGIRKQQFKEINIGRDGVSLNPLEIRENDIRGPLSVAVRVAGTFNRIYNIGVHQEKILREVIIEIYAKRGIFEEFPETWGKEAPYLSDLANTLESIMLDEEDSRRKVAESTLSHISAFFAYNSFNPDGTNFSWSNVIGTKDIVVLQLSGLDGKTQKVVTEFLLWDIYSFMASRGQNPLSCFLVLDEAHNLSFRNDTPVDKIVREARKFGLATILASQQPEDFSGAVFSNTGTKICFQIAEQSGKFVQKIASKCKRNVNEIREILSTLPKANVFVLTGNEGHVCKVISHEERGFR